MKNLITAIFLLFSISLFAQEPNSPRSEMSNEEMATLGAKRLTMQLDLTAQQEEKLKTFYLDQMESRRKLMEKSKKERDEIRQDRMEMNEDQKEELRKILTEEQFTKWEQLQEKRRKGRKAPMRERQN
ncbi:hypothetical protein [Christiangramia forsetii]|uniref:Secreted protein n=2 Tax=Christiangramia forsetii TaxID=411153 RepID=A0M5I1_CHRFK|nr:hypothetical protein [Christiangramia forsetii]CAL67876.1 conserved hypothetical protein, secreted [Christiangramia forsetii KT0803]